MKYKVGQIITFDLMGYSKRKGKITGFKETKDFGTLVLTKKFAVPINRIDKYMKRGEKK